MEHPQDVVEHPAEVATSEPKPWEDYPPGSWDRRMVNRVIARDLAIG